jgi:hypothetical protein
VSSAGAVQLQQPPNSHQHKPQQHVSQAGNCPYESDSSSTNQQYNSSSSSGNSSSEKVAKGTSFQLHKVLTGFQLIWQSDYLLLVCSNLLLTYVSGLLSLCNCLLLQS